MRRLLVGIGIGLFVLFLGLANRDLEQGDSYCGTVFRGGNDGSACEHQVAVARASSGALLLAAVTALVAAALLGAPGPDRSRIATVGLAALAGLLLLAAANRLLVLDPEGCGNVFTHEHSENAGFDQTCDDALMTHGRQAIGAGLLGLVAGAAAVAVARRGRREDRSAELADQPSSRS
jgi:branched-subunit amino acid transport protein